jgi:hypothetical protein
MLHVGLDLSRRRLDVCALSERGELVEELAAAPPRPYEQSPDGSRHPPTNRGRAAARPLLLRASARSGVREPCIGYVGSGSCGRASNV